MTTKPTAELIAKHFHEAYERLAPQFGYTTRKESSVAWDDVPEANKRLMVAVCKEVITDRLAEQEAEIERLKSERQDFLNALGRSISRVNDLMDKRHEELLKKYPYLQQTAEGE